MNDAKSQAVRIFEYLYKGHTLTGLDALDKFGCFRLPARIADIKRNGWIIVKQMVTRNGKRIAEYRMVK
jgi:hypothetical protein